MKSFQPDGVDDHAGLVLEAARVRLESKEGTELCVDQWADYYRSSPCGIDQRGLRIGGVRGVRDQQVEEDVGID